MQEPGPAVRRRQLGRLLRDFRAASGFKTMEAAAERSGLSRATISRIENAKQAILPKTVRLLCQAYGVGAPMLDHLLRLAEESDDRGWLVAYGDTVPDWFERYVGEESDAIEIWNYEAEFVPGLLQTADYCRAVSAAAGPDVTEESLHRLVAFRQARQERLHGEDAPQLDVVINEAALRRVVGSPEVMAEQLRHLAEMAARTNITVRALPFSAGAHPAMTNSFTMLHFPEEAGVATAYVEIDSGAIYPDRPTDFDRYTWIFRRLGELVLTAEDTAALLTKLAQEL
ncbi:Scr1 family TA system antitoxin-like transcriptional regulator [Amycolatopsis cihanbeyliensis]|uniref:Helix-turn-helix protein n=1 Tax=Amycolatopsis cihanbeyliensis TaxID=1128664 RepID=A0A542DL26_AMYCI|nr:Scr1 family TA system antitoxin-like transcriptional regulator [Amycolatopsis cihanbeyliensis]TQJ03788.1 helix-turn-helix protein [Amycolatopsis cihanbeyliensis]